MFQLSMFHFSFFKFSCFQLFIGQLFIFQFLIVQFTVFKLSIIKFKMFTQLRFLGRCLFHWSGIQTGAQYVQSASYPTCCLPVYTNCSHDVQRLFSRLVFKVSPTFFFVFCGLGFLVNSSIFSFGYFLSILCSMIVFDNCSRHFVKMQSCICSKFFCLSAIFCYILLED